MRNNLMLIIHILGNLGILIFSILLIVFDKKIFIYISFIMLFSVVAIQSILKAIDKYK
jgi:hypothetical protein